ncbi:hypothetical protein [Maridesulfovibrio sp. FT414]|uniref:hypothetical protein n=1 Tax=Maridesulfovibrio sp. FT414 TaxID=2979469 RepID=UPI003D803AB2
MSGCDTYTKHTAPKLGKQVSFDLPYNETILVLSPRPIPPAPPKASSRLLKVPEKMDLKRVNSFVELNVQLNEYLEETISYPQLDENIEDVFCSDSLLKTFELKKSNVKDINVLLELIDSSQSLHHSSYWIMATKSKLLHKNEYRSLEFDVELCFFTNKETERDVSIENGRIYLNANRTSILNH